jgi:hypothetical protein
MSGWEEGEDRESGFEPELSGWRSFVGHGVDIVRVVKDMNSNQSRRRRRR